MTARTDEAATPRISLRAPLPGDEAGLAELCGELGYPSSQSSVARRLMDLSGRSDHLVLVAVDGAGDLVGWIHTFVARRVESDPFAEVGGMVVAATHRGGGVGACLLAAAEEWARKGGVAAIRVRSNVVREDAHRFYERAGYRRRKTAHVFTKALPQP